MLFNRKSGSTDPPPSPASRDIRILKLQGISQYVLRTEIQDISFIVEDDAQRCAQHMFGYQQRLAVEIVEHL